MKTDLSQKETMDLREHAESLYNNHGHCAFVERTHDLGKKKYIEAQDAEGLKKFKEREKERSIDLYQRSLETAVKLDLPISKFYDMYSSKDLYKANKILSGMLPEAILAVIEHKGDSVKLKTLTEEVCELDTTIDGFSGVFKLTMEEIKDFPGVKERLEDPESIWAVSPKEALFGEAVHLVARSQFLKLFTPESKVAKQTKSSKNYKEIAQQILMEQVYNIEDAAYEELEFLTLAKDMLKTAKEHDINRIMNQVRQKGTEIRNACISTISKGLELSDRMNLPREFFYGIATKTELLELTTLSNIKQKWIIDILRHFGYIILIERMNRNICQVSFNYDGDRITRKMTIDDLMQKKDVATNMSNPEHFVAKRTEIKLFYEVMRDLIKEYFRPQFSLPPRKMRANFKKTLIDINALIYASNEELSKTEGKKQPLHPIDAESLEEKLIQQIASEALDFNEQETPSLEDEKESEEDMKAYVDKQREKLKKIFASD